MAEARKTGRPITELEIWKYFYQILLALNHCHHPGSTLPRTAHSPTSSLDSNTPRRTSQVLHRDIKPENVFLSDTDDVKLGDFGLSKQMTANFANTYVGVSSLTY